MPSPRSQFDASASAAGYLHQFQYALLFCLRSYERPDHHICLERLDDVSLHEPDGTVVDLRQTKRHTERKGNLGNKSADVWKTLRVWSEAISSGVAAPERCHFFLVTNSESGENSAVRLLRVGQSDANRQEAQRLLEKAGLESTNSQVQECHKALMQLSERQRSLLFQHAVLLDGPDSDDLAPMIDRQFHTVPAEHLEDVRDRIVGWWNGVVLECLCGRRSPRIQIDLVLRKQRDIVSQLKRGGLPEELSCASVPAEEVQDEDERPFVRQLGALGISGRIRRDAQEDHYRAYTQRSRWVREQLLGIDEQPAFERRLVDRWKNKFDWMLDSLDDDCGDDAAASEGRTLYRWAVVEAPEHQGLWIRQDFPEAYMVRGSFHMLADQLRIGWHPHYEQLFPLSEQDSAAEDGREI